MINNYEQRHVTNKGKTKSDIEELKMKTEPFKYNNIPWYVQLYTGTLM